MPTKMAIDHVLVLSYYEPWVGGGAHRPRQLALADLEAGRSVDFLFCSTTGIQNARRKVHALPPGARLLYIDEEERITLLGATASEDHMLSWDDVLDRGKSSYVRAHNPAMSLLPLFRLAGDRGTLTAYDQMDNWGAFSRQPWGGSEVEREFVACADVVITITDALRRLTLPNRENVFVVPNAVNNDFLKQLGDKNSAPPLGRRPIVFYAGALWPDWVDWDLIDYVVRNLEEVEFQFIGGCTPPPDEDDGRDVPSRRDELSKLNNVSFVDEVPHEQLVQYLLQADVGLLPFVVNTVTDPCSPLKVFEYLAAGMPIAATQLSGISGFPGVFYGSMGESMISAINQAIDLIASAQARKELRLFAADNTWKARIESITGILGSVS